MANARTPAERARVAQLVKQLRMSEVSCSPTSRTTVFNCSISRKVPGYAPRAEQLQMVVSGKPGSQHIVSLKPQ
jgi:hypothetical protein